MTYKKVQNAFWIATNIIFDMGTGKTTPVLMLVNRREDASVFAEHDAQNYFNFVQTRAPNIVWSLERAAVGGYVIMGVQNQR